MTIIGSENIPPIALQVSVAKVEHEEVSQGSFEQLTRYDDEEHQDANEVANALQCHGSEQLQRLTEIVDRTVSEPTMRSKLGLDDKVVENLLQVLKQSITRSEPIYHQMSMPFDAVRMDTGNVDGDSQKRMFITKWAVVLRILNILKNLLVSNPKIQEELYRQKVLLQMVKLIPKAMVAREMAIYQGPGLLEGLDNDSNAEVSLDLLRMAIPICTKADVTLITFFQNSIAGSNKMQDFIRSQLWSGPMAILGITLVSHHGGTMERYSKDLSHYINLFTTLFANVSEVEIADWWELEETPLWNPQGILGHTRQGETDKGNSNNSLLRSATNLSMQLTIPTAWGSSSQLGDNAATGSSRIETVVGALMEPQTSSVQGKGVHLDRVKSFKIVDKASGGSLGLSGRESLLVVFSCITAGLKLLESSATEAKHAHTSWTNLLTKLGTPGRGGLNVWHALFKSYRRCRAIPRIMKAISLNMNGPQAPATISSSEQDSESDETGPNDSIYYLMSEAMLSKVRVTLTMLGIAVPDTFCMDRLDDSIMFDSQNLNDALIRCCVSETLVKSVLLDILTKNGANEDQCRRVINFCHAVATVENETEVSFIADLIEGTEHYECMKLNPRMRDELSCFYEDHPVYTQLVELIDDIGEYCDTYDPHSQVPCGIVLRLAIELMNHQKEDPSSHQKNQLIEFATRTAFRWLNVIQQLTLLKSEAVISMEAGEADGNTKVELLTNFISKLQSDCHITATECLEVVISSLMVSEFDAECAEMCLKVCESSQGKLQLEYFTTLSSHNEPNMNELATKALADLAKLMG